MTTEPRPRPRSFDDLGFEPQPPVTWFSPGELVQTAKKLTISKVFGDYADKRELIGTLPDPGIADYSDRDELWVDYVADLGDGFDATYSVASLLAAEKLELDGPGAAGTLVTRRGDVLVMGGDEVYPAASIETYEQRTTGPYEAALPGCETDPPDLFVVPGNHDWYDGLTAWMRMFTQRKWIGGWQTRQSRSYFALRLPHGWWLWGIDVQFDSYIDVPQMDYFRRVVDEAVRPGDQIVLCSATPEWVNCHRDDPESFRTLDYFERHVIADSGASLRVSIAGDAHHYAHYASDAGDLHRFTSGGGGAYLSATHGLPDRLALPPTASTDRSKTDPAVGFRRVAEFPDCATSKRLGRGVWRLGLLNRRFAALIGAVYVFYAVSALSVASDEGFTASPAAWLRGFADAVAEVGVADVVIGLVAGPLPLLVSLVLATSMIALSKRRGARRLIVGGLHLLFQSALMVGLATAAFTVAAALPGPAALAVALATCFVGGAIVGSLALAAYFSFGDTFGRNVNEQFSAMHIEDHKNFLRMHIASDGAMTIYPIGLRRVVHDWRVHPEGGPDDPWLVPDGDALAPELIEPPSRLERRTSS